MRSNWHCVALVKWAGGQRGGAILKEIMTADSKSFSAKIGRKAFTLNNSQKSSNINRFINFRAKSFNKQNYSCMYTLRHVCSVIEYASKLICHWSRRKHKKDRERSLLRQREREKLVKWQAQYYCLLFSTYISSFLLLSFAIKQWWQTRWNKLMLLVLFFAIFI